MADFVKIDNFLVIFKRIVLLLSFSVLLSSRAVAIPPPSGICSSNGYVAPSNLPFQFPAAEGVPVVLNQAPHTPTTPGPTTVPPGGSSQGVSKQGTLKLNIGPVTVTSGADGGSGGGSGSSATKPNQPPMKVYTHNGGGGGSWIEIFVPVPGVGLVPIPIPMGPVSSGPPATAGGGGAGQPCAPSDCNPACATNEICSGEFPVCACVEDPQPTPPPATPTVHPTTQPIVASTPDPNLAGGGEVGSAGGISTLMSDGNRPNRGGDWFYTFVYPIILWNYLPTATNEQLIAYFPNGTRFVFGSSNLADPMVQLVRVDDQFGNATHYDYNFADASRTDTALVSVRSGGVKTIYESSSNVITIHTELCNLNYSNCIRQEPLRQKLTYSGERLAEYETNETPFSPDPTSIPLGLYQTSTVTTNRAKHVFGYNGLGLLSTYSITRPSNESLTAASFTWDAQGKLDTISAPTGNGANHVMDLNYPTNQVEVTDNQTAERSLYTYDADGHIVERREYPGSNTGISLLPYKVWSYTYLRTSFELCPLVTKLVFPSSAQWNGEYDYLLRLSKETYSNPAGGGTLVSSDYGLGEFLDGNPILWETDPNGHQTDYTYLWEAQLVDPLDPRGRARKITASTSFTDVNDVSHPTSWEVTYTDNGRIDKQKDPAGVVTKFEYEATGAGTGRGLLLSSSSGPDNGSGDVDLNSANTTFARMVRVAPLGVISEFRTGPSANERVISYSYDQVGRVTGSTFGNAQSKLFYDWLGNIASIQQLADVGGHLVEGPGGSQVIGTANWYRTDYVKTNGYIRGILTDLIRSPSKFHNWGTIPNSTFAIRQYNYQPSGQVDYITDELGNRYNYSWNGYGNLYRISLEDGTLLTELIEKQNAMSEKVLVKDTGSALETATTDYFYSPVGSISSVKMPNDLIYNYSYDQVGNLTKLTERKASDNTLLKSRQWEYDELGRTKKSLIDNPISGASTQLEKVLWGVNGVNTVYDQFNQPQSIISYDNVGRVKQLISRGKERWLEYYAHSGDIEVVGNSAKASTTPGVQGSNMSKVRLTYDANGRVATASLIGDGNDPALTYSFDYDPLSHIEKATYPDNSIVEQTVGGDGFGWLVKVNGKVRGKGKKTLDTTTHHETIELIDPANRKTIVVKGMGGIESYTLPGASAVNLTYDRALALKTVATNTATLQYAYDALGRREEVTANPGSIVRRSLRDGFDRIYRVEESEAGNTTAIQYGFGQYGEIASEAISDGAFGTRTTEFDRNGPSGFDFYKIHKVRAAESNISWERTFDPQTSLITDISLLNAPAGVPQDVLTMDYDRATPLGFITANGGGTTFFYDDYGRLSKTITPSGVLDDNVDYVYDNLSRISQIKRINGSPTPNGSATEVTYGSVFKYDNQFRLSGRKDGVLGVSEFNKSYDDVLARTTTSITYDTVTPSLRTSVVSSGGISATTNYTIHAASGRYSAIGGSSIGYDDDGRIISVDSRGFDYDSFGRLREVTDGGTSSLGQYRYLPDHRLLMSSDSSGEDFYRWVGERIYASEHKNGANYNLDRLNVFYPYVLNERLATFKANGATFDKYYSSFVNTSPGSTYKGDTLSLKEMYAYGADGKRYVFTWNGASFGAPDENSTNKQELSFQGTQKFADSKLHYVRHRWYDDKLGIFTERDPLSPTSYSFADNDNVNREDPLGLQSKDLYSGYEDAGVTFPAIDEISRNRYLLLTTPANLQAYLEGKPPPYPPLQSGGIFTPRPDDTKWERYGKTVGGDVTSGIPVGIGLVGICIAFPPAAPWIGGIALFGSCFGVGYYGSAALDDPSPENLGHLTTAGVGAVTSGYGMSRGMVAPRAGSGAAGDALASAAAAEVSESAAAVAAGVRPVTGACCQKSSLPRTVSDWPSKPLPPSDLPGGAGPFPSSQMRLFAALSDLDQALTAKLSKAPRIPSDPEIVDFGVFRERPWLKVRVDGEDLIFYRSSGQSGTSQAVKGKGEWLPCGGLVETPKGPWFVKGSGTLGLGKSRSKYLELLIQLSKEGGHEGDLLQPRDDFVALIEWLSDNIK